MAQAPASCNLIVQLLIGKITTVSEGLGLYEGRPTPFFNTCSSLLIDHLPELVPPPRKEL